MASEPDLATKGYNTLQQARAGEALYVPDALGLIFVLSFLGQLGLRGCSLGEGGSARKARDHSLTFVCCFRFWHAKLLNPTVEGPRSDPLTGFSPRSTLRFEGL